MKLRIKNIIKSRLLLVQAFSFAILSFSNFAFAAVGEQGKIPNPLKGTNSLSQFFDSIVGVAIELGTIVAVLGIIYGGFQFVTAQGNEEKISMAKKTLTWAVIGTAVLLGARTIMAAITGTVGQL